MAFTSIITGQWRGYFEYGYTYNIAGERVSFIWRLNEFVDGQYKGSCVEVEGAGVDPEIAIM